MASDSADEADKSRSRKSSVRKRAQLWMTKGGLVRDDSDDELGEEDHPWEWIYDHNDENNKESEQATTEDTPKSSRRRTPRPNAKRRRTIVGARMGSFECALGQVVLLKSPEPGKDWIGIITEFVEQEDPDAEDEIIKSANIMWFASPDEFMSTRNKRRADALPNEQYLTADFNVNPLTSISGKATVMSKDAFYARYPDGAPPKGKEALAEFNKCIVVRRGVNQLQGRYTEEFVWEDVYREDRVFDLITLIKDGLKAAKKRKQVDDDVSDVPDWWWIHGANVCWSMMTRRTTPRKRMTLSPPHLGKGRRWLQTLLPNRGVKRPLPPQLIRGRQTSSSNQISANVSRQDRRQEASRIYTSRYSYSFTHSFRLPVPPGAHVAARFHRAYIASMPKNGVRNSV